MTRTSLTPEGKVKKKIKSALDEMGVFHFSPNASGLAGKAGIPDIICCVNGRFVGLEVKGPGGKVSKLQERRAAEIKAAGGVVWFVFEETLANVVLSLEGMRSHKWAD